MEVEDKTVVVVVKRKPGRPRKVKDQVVEKKNEDGTPVAQVDPPEKKKRGRKKKTLLSVNELEEIDRQIHETKNTKVKDLVSMFENWLKTNI
jgi:hypothetical protein